MKVGKTYRHIGFTKKVCAGGFKPLDCESIFCWLIVAKIFKAPSGRRVGNDVGLLDGHGDAVQWTEVLASCQRGVRVAGVVKGAIEYTHHYRVDFSITLFDSIDIEFGELE